MTPQDRARVALAQGDLQAAATLAAELVRAHPDRPEGYFLSGIAAAEAGQIGKAVPLIEAAVERGACAEYLAHLAKLLILLRRDGEARAAARRAMTLAPADALTLDTIGCVLARLGDHEESLKPFAAAVAAEPRNLDYRYNLAAASGFTGRVSDARDHYEVILAADPGNARAHYGLAILSRQSEETNHVPRLEAALKSALPPGDALRIRYALAKELEDLGHAPQAFEHLSAANAAQKQALGYDFAQDAAIFDALEEAFSPTLDHHAVGGTGGPTPIFIVGMPRTGTTLVDRIISSHREVEAAGELQAMPLAVKQQANTPSRRIIDPETIRAAMGTDRKAIAAAYLARSAHHRRTQLPRFTDKLPANFLYIGYIASAFPDARIVCLRRNPMDTIWSNYKNLFASQSAYYAYSYDLMDTARYYARFDRLMARWEQLFPGRMLQLSYERLVADQEGQTRLLLGHCGLDWDDGCLMFHQNRSAVATPSAAQVRRPINADGVGRWRAHAEQLEPARKWLRDQGVDA